MIFSRFASSDVDECSADVHICGSNANCTNTNGSYYCSCHSGFTRSGKECVGKDIMYRLLLKLLILFVWDTQKASCQRTLLIFINCSSYKFTSCSVLVRHLSLSDFFHHVPLDRLRYRLSVVYPRITLDRAVDVLQSTSSAH